MGLGRTDQDVGRAVAVDVTGSGQRLVVDAEGAAASGHEPVPVGGVLGAGEGTQVHDHGSVATVVVAPAHAQVADAVAVKVAEHRDAGPEELARVVPIERVEARVRPGERTPAQGPRTQDVDRAGVGAPATRPDDQVRQAVPGQVAPGGKRAARPVGRSLARPGRDGVVGGASRGDDGRLEEPRRRQLHDGDPRRPARSPPRSVSANADRSPIRKSRMQVLSSLGRFPGRFGGYRGQKLTRSPPDPPRIDPFEPSGRTEVPSANHGLDFCPPPPPRAPVDPWSRPSVGRFSVGCCHPWPSRCRYAARTNSPPQIRGCRAHSGGIRSGLWTPYWLIIFFSEPYCRSLNQVSSPFRQYRKPTEPILM